jgi:hypothetical protein
MKYFRFLVIALFCSHVIHAKAIKMGPKDKAIAKDWNFMVYIAANNNLHSYGIYNLRQMMHVGSTNSINILVQLDKQGDHKINRYYIEKDKAVSQGQQSHAQSTTSGTSESLYNFVKWGVQSYPAKHQCLVLWNHGSGIKDPSIWGRLFMAHRDELYSFNTDTGLLEIERDTIDAKMAQYFKKEKVLQEVHTILEERGIAFNDTHKQYLTNQDLYNTLSAIKTNVMRNKKLDIICMDACHMAMVEVATQIKHSADYFVASEEVEPGNGYNYIYLLEPFAKRSMTPEQFAQHTVTAYQREYRSITADYTQSAVNLAHMDYIENNVKQLSVVMQNLLIKRTSSFDFASELRALRRDRKQTTTFCDYDYIDFCHFYKSLYGLFSQALTRPLPSEVLALLKNGSVLVQQGVNAMQNIIIRNASGARLPQAYGLSFYFPTRRIHKSYPKTIFDKVTQWSNFLRRYLNARNNTHTENKLKETARPEAA